jgi:IMP dehydrogenase
MKEAYTFDDVGLVPQFNNIPSRTEPILETWLTRNRKINIPIVNSNMDTVIGEEMADVLLEQGSTPIFHRFAPEEMQSAWVKKYGEKIFVSCGLHHIERTRKLLDLGASGVCIDVAHGHSHMMFAFIEELKRTHPDCDVVAGNVCTPMAYHDLVNAGADAIKVGIGPGAACTTRLVTGFGVPQFSAIRECSTIANRLRVPMIADGGIRTSRDIVLALAAGANTVMVGKILATTFESAANKRETDDSPTGWEANYRGQASEDFQTEFYGAVKEKTAAEGVDFWSPVVGSAADVIDKLLGGLRSGLTYGGARNIKELQRKAEFVVVTANYMQESRPREKE